MNYTTLVLNGDGQMLSAIPLSVISWQDAIKLSFLNKADIIEIYENSKISSQKLSMSVPSVIMLKKYHKNYYNPEFNRTNLIYRDEFKCQYCLVDFHPKLLTVDHVIPKSKGGLKNWTNSVLACQECNRKKADKYIKPNKLPYKPTYYELFTKRKKYPLIISSKNWIPYLNWDESLIRFGKTHTSRLILDDKEI